MAKSWDEMTEAERKALVEKLVASSVSRTEYNEKRRKAISKLIEAHKAEFESLMKGITAPGKVKK